MKDKKVLPIPANVPPRNLYVSNTSILCYTSHTPVFLVATSFACLCFNLLIKSLGLEVFASCLREIDFSVSKTHGGEELNTEYTCDGGDSVVY